MNLFHPLLRIVTLRLSKGLYLLLLSIFACFGSCLFAADINVMIPGGSSSKFTTKVYFNYDQLGSGGKKTLHVFPSPCYRFSSPPSVTGDGNVMIISTGTGTDVCGVDFNVWLISGKEGWAYVNGAIEPGNYCGCNPSGGTGTPPTGRGFQIDILNSLAWVYYTNPVNGTNLTACAGCTNDIAVSVVLGNLTSPTSGTVTWTPSPANLGSVTPNSVALSCGNAATKFYAAASGGIGLITANAHDLNFTQGNPVASVSTNLTVKVVAVASLKPSAGLDIATLGFTTDIPTYLVQYCPNNSIIVTATPVPPMADNSLPACWTMTPAGVGGMNDINADGTVSRTKKRVDTGTIGVTTVTATAGTSTKSIKIIVYQAKFEIDADHGKPGLNTDFGHSWWQLSIVPKVMQTFLPGLIYYQGIWGYYGDGSDACSACGFGAGGCPGQADKPGNIDHSNNTVHTTTGSYHWCIDFMHYRDAVIATKLVHKNPGTYCVSSHNCTTVAEDVEEVAGVPVEYSGLATWMPKYLSEYLNTLPSPIPCSCQ